MTPDSQSDAESPSLPASRAFAGVLVLIAVHVLLTVWLGSRFDGRGESLAELWPWYASAGAVAAQAMLLGTGLTLREAREFEPIKFGLILMLFSFGQSEFAFVSPAGKTTNPLLSWATALLVGNVLVGAMLRRLNWRWRLVSAPVGPAPTLSLRAALLTTIAVAVALAVFRWLAVKFPRFGSLCEEFLAPAAICFGVSAAGLLLGTTRREWQPGAGSLAFGVLGGCLAVAYLLAESRAFDAEVRLGGAITLATAFVLSLASALVLRGYGWRLDRLSRDAEPSAHSAASP